MKKFTEEEEKQIARALAFAKEAHHHQHYGVIPYYYHLLEVVDNVEFHNGSAEDVIIAILHDTIEDTSTTKEDILENFNANVADIVDLLTNKETKEETFARIRTNKTAVFIKLCDRLANVSRAEKIQKYREEHELFRSVLYKDDEPEFDNIWRAIENKLYN